MKSLRKVATRSLLGIVLLCGATYEVWAPARAGEVLSRDSTPTPARNPLATLERLSVRAEPIRGRVEQRLAAGSYTYLALRREHDHALVWAVTLGEGQPPGVQVSVRSIGHRTQFHSPRLQRTFPELVFGIVSRLD